MFVGMITTVHLEHGFFMNWFGTNKGEGYEYQILVLGICCALILQGGGSASVDRLLTIKKFNMEVKRKHSITPEFFYGLNYNYDSNNY